MRRRYWAEFSSPKDALACRPWSNVLGFSTETLIAVTCNIESMEFRRQLNDKYGPENPRASSTDDVECFFSVMHEHLGKDCSLKQFQNQWRVACHEFGKRLDASIPFYYHTSSKKRFAEIEPDFDESTDEESRLQKAAFTRREHIGRKVIGRSSMIVRGSSSIRQMYHAGPVSLPPLPDVI